MAVRKRKGGKNTAAAAATSPSGKATEKVEKKGPYTSYVNQFVILAALLLPWVFLLRVPLSALGLERETVYTVEEIFTELASDLKLKNLLVRTHYLNSPEFWKTVAALSTPHVFYFIVWTNAEAFYKLASKYLRFLGEPFEAFAKLAHLIKLFQIIVVVVWYCTVHWFMTTSVMHKLVAFEFIFSGMEAPQFILGVELFLLGQLFNGGVYSAIGEDGVYYGVRLHRTIPWVFDFPFNTVPHPQYLGATLSIWGAFVLFVTQSHVDRGIFGLTVAMTCFYAFSSFVEEYL